MPGFVQAGLGGLGQSMGPAVIKPTKSLTSLLTTVDLLSFSPDGQVWTTPPQSYAHCCKHLIKFNCRQYKLLIVGSDSK